MKKTFTINISGIIFHIDEDAYDKLNRYLESIKSYFKKSEGRDEIIADIESRIAEILQERMSDTKQVVNIEDVDHVTEMMGQPSDFAEEDEPVQEDKESKERTYYSRTTKRLYRDPENKMIGGVCGGLGAYFNTDPLWFRLAIVALVIFSGIGLLVYIILWIVVPEAFTTAERLEMRGEPVNVSNIEKSIREEFDRFKDKLQDLSDEAKKTFKKKSSDMKRNSDPVANTLKSILKLFFRIIVIFIGIFLTIISVVLIISILLSLLSFGGIVIFDNAEIVMLPVNSFLNLIVADPSSLPIILITLLIVIGLPVIMLLVGGVRLIFGLRGSKVFGAATFYIWIIGVILLVIFSFRIARDFRQGEVVVENTLMKNNYENIYLNLNRNFEINEYYDEDHYIEIYEWDMIIADVGNIFYGMPELKIVKSEDDQLELTTYSRGRGKNKKLALERADNIIYDVVQRDSLLTFDEYFVLPEEALWRAQEVDIELKVPVGMTVHVGNNLHHILGYHRYYSRYNMSGRSFIMTKSGLKPVEEPDVDEISANPKPFHFLLGFMGSFVGWL